MIPGRKEEKTRLRISTQTVLVTLEGKTSADSSTTPQKKDRLPRGGFGDKGESVGKVTRSIKLRGAAKAGAFF